MGDGFSLYCMRMLPIVLFGYMKKHNTTVLKSFYGHYLFGKLSLMLGELLSSSLLVFFFFFFRRRIAFFSIS